jgi:hypothetical protein
MKIIIIFKLNQSILNELKNYNITILTEAPNECLEEAFIGPLNKNDTLRPFENIKNVNIVYTISYSSLKKFLEKDPKNLLVVYPKILYPRNRACVFSTLSEYNFLCNFYDGTSDQGRLINFSKEFCKIMGYKCTIDGLPLLNEIPFKTFTDIPFIVYEKEIQEIQEAQKAQEAPITPLEDIFKIPRNSLWPLGHY